MTFSDRRKLKVMRSLAIGLPKNLNTGTFSIVDRYPKLTMESDNSKLAQLMIKEQVGVEFQCTSNQEWNICLWKRPNSDDSCGIFGQYYKAQVKTEVSQSYA